jgi:hypothetical protein
MDLIEAQQRKPLPGNPSTELPKKRPDVSAKTPGWVDKSRTIPDEFYADPPCTD